MSQACPSEPISYLRLERYLLDEGSAGEREHVRRHLDQCEVCRGCFEALRSDSVELPALPLPIGRKPLRRRLWSRVALGGSLAMAAAALLMLRTPSPGEPAFPAQGVGLKGGELAIELVREHGGDIANDPTRFVGGDRFQVRVSCPPEDAPDWELVVFQDAEQFFPLRAGTLTCGNAVTLPGAFSLTGSAPARVCVVLGAHGTIDRGQLARRLPERSACVLLEPTR